MGTVIICVIVGLVLLGTIARQVGRTIETVKGHSKCHDCKKRLKPFGLAYATTCSHCGHKQPWAAGAPA